MNHAWKNSAKVKAKYKKPTKCSEIISGRIVRLGISGATEVELKSTLFAFPLFSINLNLVNRIRPALDTSLCHIYPICISVESCKWL